MTNHNHEQFHAPHLHIEQPTHYENEQLHNNYFQTDEQSQQLEISNWYDDVNQNNRYDYDAIEQPNFHQRPDPPGPPFGPGPFGPGPFGPGPFGPGPYGPGPFGPGPYGPGPFGPGPFGPGPYGPGPFGPGPFGPGPFGPGPFGPIVPIPVPMGTPRPSQPDLAGKCVYVIIQGGEAYRNATATYQVQFIPGITVYQSLLSTGAIQLADNGQVLAVSGVTINDHVRYSLNLNGKPVYTTMLNYPLTTNDVISLDLIYE